ncbi:Ankyrin repeat family protein, partial [Thalictrum thalictroides]
MEIDSLTLNTEIDEKELFDAAEKGDSSIFKSLSPSQLQKASTFRNEDGRSLLHVSASSGHAEVVKVLAIGDTSGSVVNSTDEEGWAPIHSAASIGNAEILEILLSK